MIPNVTKGERVAGLLVYLAGPGRANEHTDPHLVAGSAPIMAWHNDDQLNRDAALAIAHQLDQAKDVLGVEVNGGHVWRCSLSLRAEEGDLTDQKWAEIATEFMDQMGFTEASGKAPTSWVAIRHGHSTAGNDHIHIAASMVREDGTKWSSHLDFKRPRTRPGRWRRSTGSRSSPRSTPRAACAPVSARQRSAEASRSRSAARPEGACVRLGRAGRGRVRPPRPPHRCPDPAPLRGRP